MSAYVHNSNSTSFLAQVRKDRWIRRRKVRMVGATFRKNSDLPPNAFASFGLSRQPDWSFADGTPGYLVSFEGWRLVIFCLCGHQSAPQLATRTVVTMQKSHNSHGNTP